MRAAPLPVLLLGVLTGACFPIHAYVNGTASYAATPRLAPLAGTSGALPMLGIVCAATKGSGGLASIRLGEGCILRGPWMTVPKVRGGSAELASDGACTLPFADRVSPVRVQSGTLSMLADAVDATVGGVTPEGTYVTYRFTGTASNDAPNDVCTDLRASDLVPAPPLPPIPEERVHVSPTGAWESGPAPGE